MPTLKNLRCTIDHGSSNQPLEENATSFGQNFVETYVAVPDFETAFTVHLAADGYIAPGLGVFVFIDGVYQCNRIKRRLVPPRDPGMPYVSGVDFRLKAPHVTTGGEGWTGDDFDFNHLGISVSSLC